MCTSERVSEIELPDSSFGVAIFIFVIFILFKCSIWQNSSNDTAIWWGIWIGCICKTFVYIGQTKWRFCDRFSEHRGYVYQKKFDQVCGEHFNKAGHSQSDMLPIILEQVTPKNDDF